MSHTLVILQVVAMLHGISPRLMNALCYVESNHNPNAYVKHDGHSPSYGLCQIKLSTARGMGFTGPVKDLFKPEINGFYAAKYLAYQHERYKSWRKALSAYNAGRISNRNLPYVNKVIRLADEMY